MDQPCATGVFIRHVHDHPVVDPAREPHMAQAIATAMQAYLAGIPDPLWALFGTGYLGYTVARQFGKAAAAVK